VGGICRATSRHATDARVWRLRSLLRRRLPRRAGRRESRAGRFRPALLIILCGSRPLNAARPATSAKGKKSNAGEKPERRGLGNGRERAGGVVVIRQRIHLPRFGDVPAVARVVAPAEVIDRKVA